MKHEFFTSKSSVSWLHSRHLVLILLAWVLFPLAGLGQTEVLSVASAEAASKTPDAVDSNTADLMIRTTTGDTATYEGFVLFDVSMIDTTKLTSAAVVAHGGQHNGEAALADPYTINMYGSDDVVWPDPFTWNSSRALHKSAMLASENIDTDYGENYTFEGVDVAEWIKAKVKEGATEVCFRFNAADEHPFDIWLTGTWKPMRLQLTYDASVNIYDLAVTIVGDGEVDLMEGSYVEGQSATLTATPDPGWMWGEWSVDATGTDNPLTVTFDADKNITATFTGDGLLTIDSEEAASKTPDAVDVNPADLMIRKTTGDTATYEGFVKFRIDQIDTTALTSVAVSTHGGQHNPDGVDMIDPYTINMMGCDDVDWPDPFTWNSTRTLGKSAVLATENIQGFSGDYLFEGEAVADWIKAKKAEGATEVCFRFEAADEHPFDIWLTGEWKPMELQLTYGTPPPPVEKPTYDYALAKANFSYDATYAVDGWTEVYGTDSSPYDLGNGITLDISGGYITLGSSGEPISPILPDKVSDTYNWMSDADETPTDLVIMGLDPAKTYDFEIFASRDGATASGDRTTTFTVVGTTQSVSINPVGNTDSLLMLSGVAPAGTGAVMIQMTKLAGAYGYINAMIISEEGAGEVGVSETILPQIRYYPVPTRSLLYVEGLPMESKISAYDIAGREVLRQEADQQERMSIDMSKLNQGLYIFRVENKGSIIKSFKAIKQ
jgi:Divergent InlB B-repeat domain/Secretion system C-terminal sorting domain